MPCRTEGSWNASRRTMLQAAAGGLLGWGLLGPRCQAGSPGQNAAQAGTAPDPAGAEPRVAVAPAQPQPQRAGRAGGKAAVPARMIASANGLKALQKAFPALAAGKDPLDACLDAVVEVENDPDDYTVGYGGLPNEDGVVQLDAAVMHGPTHQAGAVAALERIRNPCLVAKLVMQRTDHVLLVGQGALEFAKAHGFKEENLLTEKARKIWLYWKENLSDQDDWLAPPPEEVDPEVWDYFGRPTGTVHVSAINSAGDLSCVTSTSGLAFKVPGRVGDSPIVGAGLYVDNDLGSCGSTGRGEANLQNLCSFAAVELLRGGCSPKEAVLEVLRRVHRKTPKRLRDEQGRPKFQLKFYLLAKDGRYAGGAMWGPSRFAVVDAQGARLEACAYLFKKPPQNGKRK